MRGIIVGELRGRKIEEVNMWEVKKEDTRRREVRWWMQGGWEGRGIRGSEKR